MNKNTIITKLFFSIVGLLLLGFSINLFFSSTSDLQPKKNQESKVNTVLSFVSNSYNYLKGANNINPEIIINTENPILINGLNITYSIEGIDMPTVIPPNIIKINEKIITETDCSTSVNETNKNVLLSCYTTPTKINSNDIIAFVDLDSISKLAKSNTIKIKIKDSNSYITINSVDQAISLKTNEFVINIIDTPKECLNIPNADINCDGKVNSYDVFLFGKPDSDLEPYIKYRLDLNQDKLVNSKDKDMFDNALSIMNNK